MNNIPIKVKLRAYTKGILPNLEDYIKDVPNDGHIYIRKYKEWIEANKALEKTKLILREHSGLGISYDEPTDTYTLWIKQENLTKEQFEQLTSLEEDTIYYIQSLTANTFINGGTAFDDGHNDIENISQYDETINGGNAEGPDEPEVHTTNARGEEI